MTAAVSRTKTLFIPMQDYAADIEDETNRWFDRDHVPERLSCAGFLACERFQLTAIQPPGWTPKLRWYKYFNVYYVEGPEVLRSEAYRLQTTREPDVWIARRLRQDGAAGLGALWGQRAVARRWSIRSLWTQRPSPWAASAGVTQPPPRTLFVVLRDVDPAHEAEVNAYLDEEAVPEMLGCPGFLGCERYQATEEPAMSIGGRPAAPGQPRYMDVYDVETPEALTSPAYWLHQASPSDRGKSLAAHVMVRGMGVYLQRPSPWAVRPL